jgi:uncharacterized RDD family membrane protein YckC
MRCPKCHYLSFEPSARCKNCGYDLALADNDLTIRVVDEAVEPLQDFDLRIPRSTAAPMTLGPIHAAPEEASERVPAVVASAPDVAAERPVKAPVARPNRPPSTTSELPLFMRGAPDTARDPEPPALVAVAPPSRPPLAVRRRPSELVSEGPRDERADAAEMAEHVNAVWAPLSAPIPPVPASAPAPVAELKPQAEIRHQAEYPVPVAGDRDAVVAAREVTTSARVKAALIDFALLAGINFGVVWLTVRVCALTMGDVLILPIVPMVGFLALLNVGYLLLFTASSGQTLGKMAAGIRVVGEGDGDALSFRQAAIREVVSLPSVVALGAGFFPALSGSGLALHDRIAHTRVVRA